MNRVFEAVKNDGTHQLVAPSVIDEYIRLAYIYKKGKGQKSHMNTLAQMLANMMYLKDYAILTHIKYDSDGNQTRVVVVSKV